MVLLGFTVFKEKLLDGTKTQTIRLPRKKHPFKVGDELQVYWRPRTKQCEKLFDAVVTKIGRKCLANMTNEDAHLDGFEDDKDGTAIQKLALTLHRLHPEADEWTMYDIVTFQWWKTLTQKLILETNRALDINGQSAHS
jgi:hypothetical protein